MSQTLFYNRRDDDPQIRGTNIHVSDVVEQYKKHVDPYVVADKIQGISVDDVITVLEFHSKS